MRNLLILILSVTASIGFSQGYSVNSYSVTIKGTSNVHEWESTAKELRAKGQAEVLETGLVSLQSLWVEIPVKSIKSPKGSIMDNKTYDALKAKQSPNITFNMERATVNPKSDYYDINATGNLSIAGVTKKLTSMPKEGLKTACCISMAPKK
ncbi:MAG: YceI family protein [Lewinellaceae bacterium]|nr:YceI family protein [Lewinellaceae bacterium]